MMAEMRQMSRKGRRSVFPLRESYFTRGKSLQKIPRYLQRNIEKSLQYGQSLIAMEKICFLPDNKFNTWHYVVL